MFSVMPLELSPVHALGELVYELSRRRRDRLGVRLARRTRPAPHRPSGLRAVSPRDLRAGHGRVRRGGQRPRQRIPRRVSGRGRARQFRAAAPLGHPVVRRGARLARADRPVRPARPARRPQRSGRRIGAGDRHRARPAARRPAAVGRRSPSPDSACRGASRCSCPGPVCAAPCRSCWRPSRSSRGVPDSIRLLNIVFILVVVYTLVQGPSLRPLAHRLGLIPQDATREIQVEVGSAGRPGGRTADDDGARAVSAAQRHDARTAAARPQRDHADHPRRPHVRARSPTPGSRSATNCSSSPPPRPVPLPNGGCARSVAEASSRTGSTNSAKPNRGPESAKPNRGPGSAKPTDGCT